MKVERISKWIGLYYTWNGASLVAQILKNFACNVGWETQVKSLGWEDPLEKGSETHSSILAWRIPWTEEPGGLQSMWSQRVSHNWATNTFTLKKHQCLFTLFLCQYQEEVMWVHSKKTSICKLETLTRNLISQPLNLELPTFQNCEKISFCCLSILFQLPKQTNIDMLVEILSRHS